MERDPVLWGTPPADVATSAIPAAAMYSLSRFLPAFWRKWNQEEADIMRITLFEGMLKRMLNPRGVQVKRHSFKTY
jgi:hypothetical protein